MTPKTTTEGERYRPLPPTTDASRIRVCRETYRSVDGWIVRWRSDRTAFPQSMFTPCEDEARRIAADLRAGREPLFDFQREVAKEGAFGPVAVFRKDSELPVSKRALALYAKMIKEIKPHVEALSKVGVLVRIPERPRGRRLAPLTAKDVAALRRACERAGLRRAEDWNGVGSYSLSITVWWPSETRL